MPDVKRGVKKQLLQKDLPEVVTLLLLNQIVKAEHKEALSLTLVHPGIKLDITLIQMITSRPADERLNTHTQAKNSRQEHTSAQNKKPTKEKKQQELSKHLNRLFLKATKGNQRKKVVLTRLALATSHHTKVGFPRPLGLSVISSTTRPRLLKARSKFIHPSLSILSPGLHKMTNWTSRFITQLQSYSIYPYQGLIELKSSSKELSKTPRSQC